MQFSVFLNTHPQLFEQLQLFEQPQLFERFELQLDEQNILSPPAIIYYEISLIFVKKPLFIVYVHH